MAAHRITLIHATAVSMAPTAGAFTELWPEAETANLLDDSLSTDLAAAGETTPAIAGRIKALARYGAEAGADAILFTCSAFGAAIDAARRELTIPVLKPNEAMIDDALDAGPRIVLLATFAPTIDSMVAEFEEVAAERGVSFDLTPRHVPGAMAALGDGRADAHDHLIATAAAEYGACDALVLAQFSMARARGMIADAPGRRVVTSPESAVLRMKSLLGA
ncbi:MAG: arylsulfatase [Proteobacteria bacterium]|nr:arylsulfatase [Pseudomonadota bacterium]